MGNNFAIDSRNKNISFIDHLNDIVKGVNKPLIIRTDSKECT